LWPEPRSGDRPILVARITALSTRWIALAAVAVWLLSGAYMFHFGASWHLDLRVYRAAGHALYNGGSPFTAYFTANRLPFTYTPFALLALSPLAFGRLGLVETGWWLISAASLTATVALLLAASTTTVPASVSTTASARRTWAVAALLAGVASLALEPVRSNFDYGQVNLILMVMIVADLTVVRPPWRGLLVGLAAAIKLTPLVFLFYFVAARQWRSLLRGAGVVAGATALTWVVLPSDSVRYWFHEVFDAGRTGALGVVSNQSWNGMVHRPPFHGGHVGTAMWLVLSLVTLAGGAVLCRWMVAQARTAEAVMVLALTELLVSPVSWTHHWSWLVLAPIVAASLWRVHRAVAVSLLVLLGLAVSAPYLWLRTPPVSYLASNALVLGGAVVLAGWVAAEWRHPAAFVELRSESAAVAGTAAANRAGPPAGTPEGAPEGTPEGAPEGTPAGTASVPDQGPWAGLTSLITPFAAFRRRLGVKPKEIEGAG
jgi:alpha-1,2-mannosyltransferase